MTSSCAGACRVGRHGAPGRAQRGRPPGPLLPRETPESTEPTQRDPAGRAASRRVRRGGRSRPRQGTPLRPPQPPASQTFATPRAARVCPRGATQGDASPGQPFAPATPGAAHPRRASRARGSRAARRRRLRGLRRKGGEQARRGAGSSGDGPGRDPRPGAQARLPAAAARGGGRRGSREARGPGCARRGSRSVLDCGSRGPPGSCRTGPCQ